MEYRQLGRTGLQVSTLSLGTVELGVEYGIKTSAQSNRPSKDEAINIIRSAVDMGINLFDTAPNYGTSEALLGEAIGKQSDCFIATKVSVPENNGKQMSVNEMQQKMNRSIEQSLRALRRETLDIVQVHNATKEHIKQGAITEVLLKARQEGKISFFGASVYGEESAKAVIKDESYDVIQVAYSMLDQRLAENILPLARALNIGVINRSALLKGVLTTRARFLPDELSELRTASENVVNSFGISWETLPETALRFCLSSGFAQTVLIGVNSRNELEEAVRASSQEKLDDNMLKIAQKLSLDDEALVNPSFWSIA